MYASVNSQSSTCTVGEKMSCESCDQPTNTKYTCISLILVILIFCSVFLFIFKNFFCDKC